VFWEEESRGWQRIENRQSNINLTFAFAVTVSDVEYCISWDYE
jgi:hypothetical protein